MLNEREETSKHRERKLVDETIHLIQFVIAKYISVYSFYSNLNRKAKWVKDNGFAGILVWETSQDDVQGNCCRVKHPLARAINFGLFGHGENPSTYGCEH